MVVHTNSLWYCFKESLEAIFTPCQTLNGTGEQEFLPSILHWKYLNNTHLSQQVNIFILFISYSGFIFCADRVLFASSVLNLCELVALRPDLSNGVKKVCIMYMYNEIDAISLSKAWQSFLLKHMLVSSN